MSIFINKLFFYLYLIELITASRWISPFAIEGKYISRIVYPKVNFFWTISFITHGFFSYYNLAYNRDLLFSIQKWILFNWCAARQNLSQNFLSVWK